MFAAVLATVLGASQEASAEIVLSNRPWVDDSGWCFGSDGTFIVGVRFTVPAGTPYTLNSVTAKIHSVTSGGELAQMTLHDDAFGTTQPGNVIATLGTQPLGGVDTHLEYTFPGGANVLEAGNSYWIGLSALSPLSCPAGWDFNAAAPTGIFTYSTTVQGTIPTDGPVDIEIDAAPLQAQAVPTMRATGTAVLLLLLAGAGLIYVRRYRT